jgi:cyclase
MLKKRIIPCLDIQNGRTVKGINFNQIKDAGDPVALAKLYAENGADELVFLDITATVENRSTLKSLVEAISRNINIPFTVGGGITSISDVRGLLQAGADKVSINSSAVKRPQLIHDLSREFGSQCIVVAIDTNLVNDKWKVFTHGGRKETDIDTLKWIEIIEKLGAGEILLTSMVHDGTKEGFAISLLQKAYNTANIPIIASGGAGCKMDFVEVFKKTGISAALAASIFHYNQIQIPELKNALQINNIPIRK